jgi:hypothetical protein
VDPSKPLTVAVPERALFVLQVLPGENRQRNYAWSTEPPTSLSTPAADTICLVWRSLHRETSNFGLEHVSFRKVLWAMSY